MNQQLIWALKAAEITPTRKRLQELSAKEDLFDESRVKTKGYKYKRIIKSFEMAERLGYEVITYIDDNYPLKLKDISLPPPVLYVRGNSKILNGIVYAGIVGARKCDVYGKEVAYSIAQQIGDSGAGIVSGGAEGVDAAAHSGALRANAPTIAVLGNGLDVTYPECNRELFEEIEEKGGAIITEFPFGEPPNGRNFPHRNRIIAAFSTAVVVARAGRRSGSLITANQAINMNKTVFAVPGDINRALSVGVNELIRDGALALVSAMDVIDELVLKEPDYFVKEREPIEIPAKEKIIPSVQNKSVCRIQGLSEYETEIVNIINDGFNTLPLIEEKITFDAARLTALLGMLEIKGIVKKSADKKYIIK